jgi:hypothetical protein
MDGLTSPQPSPEGEGAELRFLQSFLKCKAGRFIGIKIQLPLL